MDWIELSLNHLYQLLPATSVPIVERHLPSEFTARCSTTPSPMQTEYYQSYLLRLWRDTKTGPWRASLQDVATQEQFLFSTLEDLFVFLCNRTNAHIQPFWEPQLPKHDLVKEK